MCLWYNMTKHHRLMMMILGKLLMLLQSKNSHWPQVGDDDTSGIATDASVSEDQGISSRYLDEINYVNLSLEISLFRKTI